MKTFKHRLSTHIVDFFTWWGSELYALLPSRHRPQFTHTEAKAYTEGKAFDLCLDKGDFLVFKTRLPSEAGRDYLAIARELAAIHFPLPKDQLTFSSKTDSDGDSHILLTVYGVKTGLLDQKVDELADKHPLLRSIVCESTPLPYKPLLFKQATVFGKHVSASLCLIAAISLSSLTVTMKIHSERQGLQTQTAALKDQASKAAKIRRDLLLLQQQQRLLSDYQSKVPLTKILALLNKAIDPQSHLEAIRYNGTNLWLTGRSADIPKQAEALSKSPLTETVQIRSTTPGGRGEKERFEIEVKLTGQEVGQ